MSASPIIADGLVIQLVDQVKDLYLVALDRATGHAPVEDQSVVEHARRRDANDFPPRPGQRRDHHDWHHASRQLPPRNGCASLVDADRHQRLDGGRARGWRHALRLDLRQQRAGAAVVGAALAQHDKDKDGWIPRASCCWTKSSASTSAGSTSSDDGFIIEAEWTVARALGMGAWGAIALTPGAATGQLPATACAGASRRTCRHPDAAPLSGRLLHGQDRRHRHDARSVHRRAAERRPRHGRARRGPRVAGRGRGRVYAASLEGKITVLKSGGQWEILAQNDLREEISATPALANGRLYVRTRGSVYCFASR